MDSLYKKLMDYSHTDYVPFHMPGHKRKIMDFKNPFLIDITEIDEFDDLHHANGILREGMDQAASLYGSDRTYYLVNGSTCGILSALSCLGKQDDKILVARNCHKSVYNSIQINGYRVKYICPGKIPNLSFFGSLSPEEVAMAIEQESDICGIVLTSPTYEGVVSDVAKIADIAHTNRIPVIVDEAHGAHFPFSSLFPQSAIELGADVVIQSLHKTLPALTQTAILHCKGPRVPYDKLEHYLKIYQSSSPSYVLLASIQECLKFMEEEGGKQLDLYYKRLILLRDKIKELENIQLYDCSLSDEIWEIDRSKLVLYAKDFKPIGYDLYQHLRTQRIQPEFFSDCYVLLMTSLADEEKDYERLLKSLKKINQNRKWDSIARNNETIKFQIPDSIYSIKEALDMEFEEENLNHSVGRVSASYLYQYPPGIPILVPGEKIGYEQVQTIQNSQKHGIKINGLSGSEYNRIKVIADRSSYGKTFLYNGKKCDR